MNLDLTNVRAKLARSQEHFQAVNREVSAWFERKPYSIIQQANPDNTRYSVILRVNEPAPFQRWSLMIGDCLNNLRSALDHLIYTVAAHESAPKLPGYERKLQFPLTDSRVDFDDAVKRRQLGEISEPVRAVIETMQPYNRPHPTLPPLLTILRTLNNADKHRLIQLTNSAVATGEFAFSGEAPQDGRVWTRWINEGEVEDNAEIVAMICDRPTPNMKYDINRFLVIVAIWHGKRDASGAEYTARSDFSALLHLLSEEVRSVIYYFCKNV